MFEYAVELFEVVAADHQLAGTLAAVSELDVSAEFAGQVLLGSYCAERIRKLLLQHLDYNQPPYVAGHGGLCWPFKGLRKAGKALLKPYYRGFF